MVIKRHVTGYDAVKDAIEEESKSGKALFVFFYGSKDEGKNWCPDCASAEPVVEAALESVPDDVTFIYCTVGDRTYWKNPENQFRLDDGLRLVTIPALHNIHAGTRAKDSDFDDKGLLSQFINCKAQEK